MTGLWTVDLLRPSTLDAVFRRTLDRGPSTFAHDRTPSCHMSLVAPFPAWTRAFVGVVLLSSSSWISIVAVHLTIVVAVAAAVIADVAAVA